MIPARCAQGMIRAVTVHVRILARECGSMTDRRRHLVLGISLLLAPLLLHAQSKPLSRPTPTSSRQENGSSTPSAPGVMGLTAPVAPGPTCNASRSAACGQRCRSHVDPAEWHQRNRDAGIPVVVDRRHDVANGGLRPVSGSQARRARARRSNSRRRDIRSEGLPDLPRDRRSRHGARAGADRDRRVARARVPA